MVKCKSCRHSLCRFNYELRHMCDDPSNCTCLCQEKEAETFLKFLGSMALGAAAFLGGAALTVTTGGLGLVGLATVAGGGALSSVGATAVFHPMCKMWNGERMTGEEYVKDLAFSIPAGAVAGPIGARGTIAMSSITSKVGAEGIKQGAIKVGGRTVIGAVSGATSSAIKESLKAVTDDDASFSGMNVLQGAAFGAVGTHFSSFNENVPLKNLKYQAHKGLQRPVLSKHGEL